jgi:hypothetical protein
MSGSNSGSVVVLGRSRAALPRPPVKSAKKGLVVMLLARDKGFSRAPGRVHTDMISKSSNTDYQAPETRRNL